jgi:hypothetical protein
MGVIRLLPIALAVACFSMAALAQSGRVYRIGFLATGNFDPGSVTATFAEGILRVLGQQGYVAGTNLIVEQRGAEAHIVGSRRQVALVRWDGYAAHYDAGSICQAHGLGASTRGAR